MNILRFIVTTLLALTLLLFVFTFALPGGNWWVARVQVQRALRAQPTLQRDLLDLDALATDWEKVVGVATYLQPLTSATHLVKSINAWDGVIALLDFGAPGTGAVLRLLDSLAGELVNQQVRLAQLATLDRAVQATGEFLERPDRTTLVALRQAYALHLAPMGEFRTQVAEWSPILIMIEHDLTELNQALAALAQDANAFNRTASEWLIPVVMPLGENVTRLSTTLSAQAEVLPGDRATMVAVVDAIVRAEQLDAWLMPPILTQVNAFVRANGLLFTALFVLLVIAFSTLWILGWVEGDDGSLITRRHSSAPRRTRPTK